MTQAPTPGPLDDVSTRLLRSGDWIKFKNDPPVQVSSNDVTCGSPHWSFIGRPDESGWMPWSGGENPVPGRMVECRWGLGDGVITRGPSDRFSWRSINSPITAFRLAPTAPVEASGSEREGLVYLADDAPVWADGIVTDGERVALAQKAEALTGTYWATDDGGDGALEWEPTHFIDMNALLSARPLALGGQHGTATDFPPDDVLACVGGQQGEKIDRAWLIDIINEHSFASDAADMILERLSTTPARAEAQDEGAAGEPVAKVVRKGFSTGSISWTKFGQDADLSDETPLYAHPSPTPAADEDRVRK